MLHRDIVAIGASAGGIEALSQLVSQLRHDLRAALFVVVHRPPHGVSRLARILGTHGPLPVQDAQDGQPIEPGRICVAVPDHHLLLKDGIIRVVHGPRENRFRPAIDPLFRSAARTYGPRAIGVILSGAGDDGVAGLRAIKARDGIAIVQDPADAAHPDLPSNALQSVSVDHRVPIVNLAALLRRLTEEPLAIEPQPADAALETEVRLTAMEEDTIHTEVRPGRPSSFSCPDCGGVLWELEDDELLRFRCRVGHAYTAKALLDDQTDTLEKGLWAAFRALEENAAFTRRLSRRARQNGQLEATNRFMQRAEEAAAHAHTIHELLMNLQQKTSEAAAPPLRDRMSTLEAKPD
jgi:two-component system chemotaxis response regulator CheB